MVLLLALAAGLPAQDSTSATILGDWAGGTEVRGRFLPVTIRVEKRENDDQELVARVAYPTRGFRHEGAVQVESAKVRIHIPTVNVTWSGEVDGRVFSGAVTFDASRSSPFQFARVERLSETELRRYQGQYRLADSEAWNVELIRRSTDRVLRLTRASTGRWHTMFPISETSFGIGPQTDAPLPRTATLSFQVDAEGRTTGFELQRAGQSPLQVIRIGDIPVPESSESPGRWRAERRDVWIDVGNVRLRGRLYFPPGAPKLCPAAVMVHGSGPSTRSDQWSFYTSIALRCGLAVLAYDKRGCGESTGSFEEFTVPGSSDLFERLGKDAAAAWAWLQKQDGIDPDRVGFVGGSQAGWIMPLAAARCEKAAFVIHGCGPAVSAGEENYHSGLTKRTSIPEADRMLEKWTGDRGFDPRPVLAESSVPMLWIFADRDRSVPTAASVAALKKVIADGNESHTIHVIPNCDHNYQNPETGDGFLLEPVMIGWLRERGVLR